ncbi:MAG: YlxR family protein [Acidimicrobiales bacterium]|nr:YlxR family protein [Acidimicrobiales bacterium]
MPRTPEAGDRPGGAAPLRTCIGCRARRPQPELLRFVRSLDAAARPDRHAPGRGAWLCPDESCWSAATKRNAWSRAFRVKTSVHGSFRDSIDEDGFRQGRSRD